MQMVKNTTILFDPSYVSNKYRKNIKKEIPQEGECIHGCATRSLRGLAFKCGCYLC